MEQLELLAEALWRKGMHQSHDYIWQIIEFMHHGSTFEQALERWEHSTPNKTINLSLE